MIARTFVTVVVTLAVLTSVAFNLRYGWNSGDDPLDKSLGMALSLVADGVKCSFLAYALTQPRFVQRIALRGLWLIASVYSMIAALGAVSLSRDAALSPRQSQSDQRQRAQADYDRADAALKAVHGSPAWATTTACTKPAKKDVAFCKRATALQADLGAATQLLNRTSTTHADPQAASLSRLTGLKPDDVRAWLPIFIAVVIEVLSAFGFYAIAVSKGHPEEVSPPPVVVTKPGAAVVAPKPTPEPLRVIWPTVLTDDHRRK